MARSFPYGVSEGGGPRWGTHGGVVLAEGGRRSTMNGWSRIRRVVLAFALLAFTSVAAAEQVLVEIGSSTTYFANATEPGIGMTWTLPGFDDSGWAIGTFGVGYDDGGNAQNLIQTDVPNTSRSVYTRTTFTVSDVGSLSNLFLGCDFDDGYVAWINGIEVFRSDSMPTGSLAWDSAPTDHESGNGLVPAYESSSPSVSGTRPPSRPISCSCPT